MPLPAEVLCVGECMIELSRGLDRRFDMCFGGDTFNTAAYLARAGIPTAYITTLGDDPYSDGIVALATTEGIQTHLIDRLPGRVPGLYMIETDSSGERRFFYWRENSPARERFDQPRAELDEAARGARLIYFSGITLWLYGKTGRARFFDWLDLARLSGAKVAFDGNFRPRLWGDDLAQARSAYRAALKRADIVLPTLEDEQNLWGVDDPHAALAHLAAQGVREIVLKNGADGAWISSQGIVNHIPAPEVVEPKDTTAAGDSFNAGYLSARLRGASPSEAVLRGHRLAAAVIRHPGAIVPRSATDAVL
jgi:2-dehydro-3-deoxygluconokinase